jgi:predicted DNA-binding protein
MRTKGKRIHADLYLDPEKHERLHRLSKTTRVPMAVYLREAVEDLLDKYRAERSPSRTEGKRTSPQ